MSAPLPITTNPFRFADASANAQLSDRRIRDDLIRALRPHWRGLERRFVLQAMRARYRMIGRCVPLKFDADIVRIFQRSCVDTIGHHRRSSTAMFYRRHEPSGEIWTLNAEQADAWLDAEGL